MSDNFNAYITETEDGLHRIATNEAPYFCVEASSEAGAIDKVRALLSFYEANANAPSKRRSTLVPVGTFATKRKISAKDLVAA